MIEGNFRFISALWQGAAASLKIEGSIVWMESHNWSDYKSINVCELSETEQKELFWETPVIVVLKHKTQSLEI